MLGKGWKVPKDSRTGELAKGVFLKRLTPTLQAALLDLRVGRETGNLGFLVGKRVWMAVLQHKTTLLPQSGPVRPPQDRWSNLYIGKAILSSTPEKCAAALKVQVGRLRNDMDRIYGKL